MDQQSLVIILACLLAISEVLALVPVIQANSIFQVVVSGLKALVSSAPKKE